MQLVGGVVMGLRGADDPDSLRGRGLGGVVMDEYADMKPALWDEIIQPSLLDTGGWADFLGTPKGFDHFYDVYRQGQERGVSGVGVVAVPDGGGAAHHAGGVGGDSARV